MVDVYIRVLTPTHVCIRRCEHSHTHLLLLCRTVVLVHRRTGLLRTGDTEVETRETSERKHLKSLVNGADLKGNKAGACRVKSNILDEQQDHECLQGVSPQLHRAHDGWS